MDNNSAVAGNAGAKVRSDCEVTVEPASGGGIVVHLESKVKTLYGNSIIRLAQDVLHYSGIENARISIKDTGALPFVIVARIEACLKQLINTCREYLPDFNNANSYDSQRGRSRFARLYVPGNTPSLMINAGLHSADGIILDLEDSVAPSKKDEARILVRNALRTLDFFGSERMVRINQGETGILDLRAVIPQRVHLVIIPKCENSDQVKIVAKEIETIRSSHDLPETYLMPVIESAVGVENASVIATASSSVVAIALGLEDYTADLGVSRTNEARESFYARTRIVNAAKAAGIQPIDSVFSDIDDIQALERTVAESKSLGFEGMGCIHPRQIPSIRRGFMPSAPEIEQAKKITFAFEDAKKHGLGVIAVGSKMVDAPVVLRAQQTIRRAISENLLPPDWLEKEMQ